MTFRRFEDIQAWQTARRLAATVYKVTQNDRFRKDFSLKDQIRRAAVSAMANIAEGLSHRSDKEFARFLVTSKASLNEVQSHAYVALDQSYLHEHDFKDIYTQAQNGSKQLAGLISHLYGRRKDKIG